MSPSLPRLWIITDPGHPAGPVDVIRRTLASLPERAVGVQLRAKQANDRELLRWGVELRRITRAHGAWLSVNGRVDVAKHIEADGVHLGETGIPVERARSVLAEALIGVSRHDGDGLLAAERALADYAFLSPVFEVPGKNQPLGIDGFATTAAQCSIPVIALGGIGPDDVRPLIDAGAYGIAIRRAIYEAEDPAAALGQFLDALDNAPLLVG